MRSLHRRGSRSSRARFGSLFPFCEAARIERAQRRIRQVDNCAMRLTDAVGTAKLLKSKLQEIDANGNGGITREELLTFASRPDQGGFAEAGLQPLALADQLMVRLAG